MSKPEDKPEDKLEEYAPIVIETRPPDSVYDLIHKSAIVRRQLNSHVEQYGQELLIRELRAFFQQNPNVDAIRWTQCTPHFNDGAPCEFGVRDPALLISDLTEEEREYCTSGDDWVESWNYPGTREKLFRDIPQAFDESMLLILFGDHALVTVYRDGRSVVEECPHD